MIEGPAPTPTPVPSPATHEFEAGEDAQRLDLLVAAALDLSRNQAATLIAEGRVLVDGRREKASYRARQGEKGTVKIPEPTGRSVDAEDIPIDVVFEDHDVLVVNKAAGMVVPPAPGNWSGTL